MASKTEGQYLYAVGDTETRDWFHRQWKVWPHRVDERLTTNISLHYGGVAAYRIENGTDPEMSDDFASWVRSFDRTVEQHNAAILRLKKMKNDIERATLQTTIAAPEPVQWTVQRIRETPKHLIDLGLKMGRFTQDLVDEAFPDGLPPAGEGNMRDSNHD